jgi:hypothetical protein
MEVDGGSVEDGGSVGVGGVFAGGLCGRSLPCVFGVGSFCFLVLLFSAAVCSFCSLLLFCLFVVQVVSCFEPTCVALL